MSVRHLTTQEIEAGLDDITRSPKDEGTLRLIVRRPRVGEREILEEAELDPAVGLVGDTWRDRRSTRTADGSPHPDMQLNVMGARIIALLAQAKERWPLAGDQLFIDLDLCEGNLPAGTQLALGSAVESAVLGTGGKPHVLRMADGSEIAAPILVNSASLLPDGRVAVVVGNRGPGDPMGQPIFVSVRDLTLGGEQII